MGFGNDPFFSLPWGASKTSVERRLGSAVRRLPDPWSAEWGRAQPPPRAAFRYSLSYDLDGDSFGAVDLGFLKDRWIGVFHRLDFVRLVKFFRGPEADMSARVVLGRVRSNLIRRYGDGINGNKEFWEVSGSVLQADCFADPDGCLVIIVVANRIDEEARRAAGL